MKYLLIAALMLPVSANAVLTDEQINTCAKLSEAAKDTLIGRYKGVSLRFAYSGVKDDVLAIEVVKSAYYQTMYEYEVNISSQLAQFENDWFAGCIQYFESK